jgi:2'-5' RNA ligase
MPLLIVAPLEAAPADLRRIEMIRRRHDPQHALIPAHVTLVFPFEAPDADAVARHMASVAAGQGAIAVRLSAFLAVRDATAGRSHVFLVPDQGRAEVEDLHDLLYSGPLAGALRSDIAFIPHVTVAARDHQDEAEDLARELGRVGVAGRLSQLQLVAFDGSAASVLARADLQA